MENQYEWIAMAAMGWSVLSMMIVVIVLAGKNYQMAVKHDEMDQAHCDYLEQNKEVLAQLRKPNCLE